MCHWIGSNDSALDQFQFKSLYRVKLLVRLKHRWLKVNFLADLLESLTSSWTVRCLWLGLHCVGAWKRATTVIFARLLGCSCLLCWWSVNNCTDSTLCPDEVANMMLRCLDTSLRSQDRRLRLLACHDSFMQRIEHTNRCRLVVPFGRRLYCLGSLLLTMQDWHWLMQVLLSAWFLNREAFACLFSKWIVVFNSTSLWTVYTPKPNSLLTGAKAQEVQLTGLDARWDVWKLLIFLVLRVVLIVVIWELDDAAVEFLDCWHVARRLGHWVGRELLKVFLHAWNIANSLFSHHHQRTKVTRVFCHIAAVIFNWTLVRRRSFLAIRSDRLCFRIPVTCVCHSASWLGLIRVYCLKLLLLIYYGSGLILLNPWCTRSQRSSLRASVFAWSTICRCCIDSWALLVSESFVEGGGRRGICFQVDRSCGVLVYHAVVRSHVQGGEPGQLFKAAWVVRAFLLLMLCKFARLNALLTLMMIRWCLLRWPIFGLLKSPI